MRSFKISILTVATIAVFLSIFKPEGLPDSITLTIQIVMLIVVLMYLFSKRTKGYDNIMLLIAIPISFSSLVAYFRGTIAIQNLFNCFFYMICLWAACQILITWVKKDKYYQLVVVLQRLLTVYCVLSLVSTVLIGVSDSATTTYLFGGKFITSYFFLLFLGLTYAKYQERIDRNDIYKLLFGLVVLIVFVFEVYLKCTTGYIIVAFFYLLVILPREIRSIMTRRAIVLAAIIASGIVPVFINEILSINAVQDFIVNILGKSTNLTSRLPIYTLYLFPLIRENIWLGHGYASSAMHLRTGVYWNAQNGLLDILLNYGVVGMIGFLIMCFKVAGANNSEKHTWPYYAVLYSFVLASTIEVSYNNMFFFVLSMIFAISYLSTEKGNEISV